MATKRKPKPRKPEPESPLRRKRKHIARVLAFQQKQIDAIAKRAIGQALSETLLWAAFERGNA